MHNSALINLNVAETAAARGVEKLFFASSACVYPWRNQVDSARPLTAESSAYPAEPDRDYGWEKLFSERLYAAYARNSGLQVRIARFHTVFGEEGTWVGGREKAPAAICRKVSMADNGEEIEIWGDGEQTRSFLYIDECLDGVRRLMDSNVQDPVNIGSAEMVSINQLARMVMQVAGKRLTIRHVPGPLGVRGRSSDNTLIRDVLGWAPSQPLRIGLARTYAWIDRQVHGHDASSDQPETVATGIETPPQRSRLYP
jgi:GDP-D-mannose 3',5'-epimerase